MSVGDELIRVRLKVERGDRLSDDELELLVTAAADNALSSRMALAHAMVNNDLGRDALGIVENLVRDYPRNADVMMLQARTLVSIERWAEAEPVLRAAALLRPDDQEILKALAVIAMRRGEGGKARDTMKDLLEKDPFDAEAQWIQSELDATQSEPLDVGVSLEGFTKVLVARLDARSTPHLVQKDKLLLKPPKQAVLRVDLRSLYQSFVEGGRPLDATVEAMARELTERTVGLPQAKAALLANVLPVVRDGGFLESAEGALRREGPAGLWFFYALFDPDFMRYVPEGVLASHQLTLEEVDAAAWKNLDERPADPGPIELVEAGLRLAAGPTGLWAVAKGDGHDSARILTRLQQAAVEQKVGPQPWRLYLGIRELVLVCKSTDAANVERIAKLAAAPDGIEGAWELRDGRIVPLKEWTDVL
jgi:tetratricopeptide (TPR) repeat protein